MRPVTNLTVSRFSLRSWSIFEMAADGIWPQRANQVVSFNLSRIGRASSAAHRGTARLSLRKPRVRSRGPLHWRPPYQARPAHNMDLEVIWSRSLLRKQRHRPAAYGRDRLRAQIHPEP